MNQLSSNLLMIIGSSSLLLSLSLWHSASAEELQGGKSKLGLKQSSVASVTKIESNSKESSSKVIKATPLDNSSKNSSVAKDKSAETKHAEEKKTTHKRASSNSLFVPPPPPSVPTMSEMGIPGMSTQMIFMGENVEYMPAAELKDLKTKTEADLAKQRRLVEEYSESAKDAKQKSESFDQLFAEGVVSRKELETSKKDNEKNIQDLIDAKQTLSMLEQKYVRIEKRLQELSKPKKSANTNSIKKKSQRK
ncbi:MAG: hypothetical protein K2X81_11415 [Candidatus Obscuribacterales bacterium]|nr:hypothetical protein [Candidatus Obscuribacterales bacterium]